MSMATPQVQAAPWHTTDADRPFLVLNGAMASELERAGVSFEGDPLWSARALSTCPERIEAVHRAYAEAGADILTTVGYQASIQGFLDDGLDRAQARALLQRAVTLAQNARARYLEQADASARRPLWVAASIGPYGAYRADGSEYTGAYSQDARLLRGFHQERLELLAASGADLIVCESIPSQREGEVLLRMLADLSDLPAWISFTCRDGIHVSHGEPLRDCVAMCTDVPNVAVGVNCVSPLLVKDLITASHTGQDQLRIAYANRGEEWLGAEEGWRTETAVEDPRHAALAAAWQARGVRVIGGCCRTGPEFVRALVQMRSRLIRNGMPGP